MKRLLSIITIIALLFVLAGCAAEVKTKDIEEPAAEQQTEANETAGLSAEQTEETEKNEKVKIGIIQPVEHPSLNQIREYIIIGLEEQGLKDKVEITYKDAQGDPSNINTIISQFVGDEMDVIVPIGTGASQSAAAATKEIPIIFAAVMHWFAPCWMPANRRSILPFMM